MSRRPSNLDVTPWFLGLTLGVGFYLGAHSLGVPVLTYLPVTGAWTWHEPPGAIAMHYYGVTLWGLLGFGIGFVFGRIRSVASRLPIRFLVPSAVALFVAGLVYFFVVELLRWSAT